MKRIGIITLAAALSLAAASALIAQEKTMMTSSGIELVWIPPGEFMMGSTQQEQAWAVSNSLPESFAKREGEQPRRARIANGFWLGRTEVTVGQWRKFVDATSYVTEAEKNGTATTRTRNTGSKPVKGISWRDPRFAVLPKQNHPVCCISWNDAMACCQWLTATEKKASKLPAGMIGRLPTEAEWEYACRAGSQTRFWWGDFPAGGDQRLTWALATEKIDGPTPADHYRAKGRNKFGLADMLGNVAEWCLDVGDDAQAHEECFKGTSGNRVLRGGSLWEGPDYCRCAGRRVPPASSTNTALGFRLAIGVSP